VNLPASWASRQAVPNEPNAGSKMNSAHQFVKTTIFMFCMRRTKAIPMRRRPSSHSPPRRALRRWRLAARRSETGFAKDLSFIFSSLS
jgi:hypothetical protein